MSTTTYLEDLWNRVKDYPPERIRTYQTFVEPLRVVQVRGDRIIFSVPAAAFADSILKHFSAELLATAQERISPKITKLRFLYPKERPKKVKN